MENAKMNNLFISRVMLHAQIILQYFYKMMM